VTDTNEFRALYVISVAAQLGGVHPQTLRNYERFGLLDPRRTAGGSRRFSDADLQRLKRIQELTNEGVNLEGVKRILQLEERLARAEEQLRSSQQEMHETVDAVRRSQRRDLVPVSNTMALYVAARRRAPEERA
jgi:MerR family transcriptional regulator/heat shock protein HspR